MTTIHVHSRLCRWAAFGVVPCPPAAAVTVDAARLELPRPAVTVTARSASHPPASWTWARHRP